MNTITPQLNIIAFNRAMIILERKRNGIWTLFDYEHYCDLASKVNVPWVETNMLKAWMDNDFPIISIR